MDFFLPVAQVQISILTILILSFIVGFISGLFGIGGGFLMTPVLIFLGIPPAFAVANEANNILGTSVSGALTHWFRRTLDYKMGLVIVIGGMFGTLVGMIIFGFLKDAGIVNVIISLAYIYMLVMIGTLMFAKGWRELSDLKKKITVKKKAHNHYWIHGLPLRVRFHKSKLYESAIVPIMLGFFVGIFSSIMGVGGAFLMVPAMIYIIGVPTRFVPGTSLFVTIFITAFVVIGHALRFQTIDFILVSILLTGSIVGVHLGLKIAEKLNASEYKTLLAILLLGVGIIMGIEQFVLEKGTLFNLNQNGEISNRLSEFILQFSQNHPVSYGFLSITIVILVGVTFSYARELVHHIRYDVNNKKYKFFG
tara:strand:+ start:11786 stop:12880 length:1095 start_codon:yes stop_codon:yes gene_type:complete